MKALIKKLSHKAGFKLRQLTAQRMQFRLGLAQRLIKEVAVSANDSDDSFVPNLRAGNLHSSSRLKEDIGLAAESGLRLVPGVRLDDLLHELVSAARPPFPAGGCLR